MPRLKRIHINQHTIKHNQKTDDCLPVITVKDYKSNTYGHEVIFYGHDGVEAGRVIYSPDHPLPCGAHVWIETRGEVEVIEHPCPTPNG